MQSGKAYYIKPGEGGEWEADSVRNRNPSLRGWSSADSALQGRKSGSERRRKECGDGRVRICGENGSCICWSRRGFAQGGRNQGEV